MRINLLPVLQSMNLHNETGPLKLEYVNGSSPLETDKMAAQETPDFKPTFFDSISVFFSKH